MTVETQTWLTERYDQNARFVSDLGAPVLDLLAPSPGERILDLGCGDGVLTRRIAEAGAEVLGIDLADDMLATARAAGLAVDYFLFQSQAHFFSPRRRMAPLVAVIRP